MAGIFDTFQTFLDTNATLRPFTETLLRSIGSSASFNYLLLRSLLTGQDCNLFKNINWTQCAKDSALRELGKRLVKQNETIRSQNAGLILELKEILAKHISADAKLYFDSEDAAVYAQALADKSSSSAQVSETLMEASLLLDSVANAGAGKYQKQLTTLQNRIADLEGRYAVIAKNSYSS